MTALPPLTSLLTSPLLTPLKATQTRTWGTFLLAVYGLLLSWLPHSLLDEAFWMGASDEDYCLEDQLVFSRLCLLHC